MRVNYDTPGPERVDDSLLARAVAKQAHSESDTDTREADGNKICTREESVSKTTEPLINVQTSLSFP